MRKVLRIAKFLCTVALLVSGPVAGFTVAIALFILSGTLVPGEPMYVGSTTPPLSTALQDTGISLAVIAGLAYARHKLGRLAAPLTVRPN